MLWWQVSKKNIMPEGKSTDEARGGGAMKRIISTIEMQKTPAKRQERRERIKKGRIFAHSRKWGSYRPNPYDKTRENRLAGPGDNGFGAWS